MRAFSLPSAALLLAGTASAYSYDDEKPSTTAALPACTATSSTGSGAYFDMRPDIAYPEDDEDKAHRAALHHKDYLSRGYDFGKNFSMNICGPVVEPITGVVGVDEDEWANVSGYYVSDGAIYSIGSASMDLRSRGRKLFVQYTGGSPCGPDADRYVSHASDDDRKKRRRRATTADDTLKQVQSVPTTDDADAPASTNADDYADDDEGESASGSDDDYRQHADDYADDMSDAAASYKDETRVRRKSALISFLCDRDPTASGTSISFVGTDPDECAYFFDARSIHACPAAEPHRPGSVGPGSVFGIIVLVAVLVYLLGGIFYNRTINNARGWRQLPNYSLWAGMWSFVSDIFIIAIHSLGRCLGRRQGYSSLRAHAVPNARESDQEAQTNALIDQLDEEWED